MNNEQPAGIMCKDFEARFCCSKPKPTCHNGEWTQWYDRDNPSGTGDHEVLNLLIKEYKGLCPKPTAIDARVKGSNIPWYLTSNQLSISPSLGLQCWNNYGTIKQKCFDYEVQFCCPKISDPDPSKCENGHWTGWYDRDNPSGTGDHETLFNLLQENPNSDLCKIPTGIQARIKSNQQPYNTTNMYQTSGNVVEVSPLQGLQCWNDQNKTNCQDFEVRFCCNKGKNTYYNFLVHYLKLQ